MKYFLRSNSPPSDGSAYPDHPVHSHGLIRVFIFCLQNLMILFYTVESRYLELAYFELPLISK